MEAKKQRKEERKMENFWKIGNIFILNMFLFCKKEEIDRKKRKDLVLILPHQNNEYNFHFLDYQSLG